jgi:hypothetical protein
VIFILLRNIWGLLVDSKRYHEFLHHTTREAVIDAQRTVAHNFYKLHYGFED